jgi:CheY-like chemotaxis protein
VPYTLLLADDSVTIQRVIELTFADEDVQVIAVSDGDQAIERLDASPPDIVLADIGMPGKNGYEVAQYIRQTPRLAHIPVVLLTGAFEPVDQARAAEAGCDGVLAKPFEPQLVIGRVKELLARSNRMPDQVDPALAPPPAAAADQWAAPPPEQPFAEPTAPAPAGLNDYFDRLDAAFSTLSSNAPAAPAKPSAPPPTAPSPLADAEIDWFSAVSPGGAPSSEPWDLPAPPSTVEAPDLQLSYASPAPPAPLTFDAVPVPAASMPAAPAEFSAPVASSGPVASTAPIAPAAPVTPSAPARPAELPPLADAFAALLAAEESDPRPASAPAWPATLSSSASTEQLVEDVTRRVLETLSDRVVRETVAEVVSRVAEQMVRDEIERIKASLK